MHLCWRLRHYSADQRNVNFSAGSLRLLIIKPRSPDAIEPKRSTTIAVTRRSSLNALTLLSQFCGLNTLFAVLLWVSAFSSALFRRSWPAPR